MIDDGDAASLTLLDDHDLAAQSGEQAPLHGENLDTTEAHSSGDDLLALYVSRRGPRRFIN